ncbi:NXPE family member 3-like [Branchiostoma lanceolatum]|uniref:NXPE family member 3-like n=1 Tax=Branchiostoma lanceolatum TaxID=7740 RepID=UPI003452B905
MADYITISDFAPANWSENSETSSNLHSGASYVPKYTKIVVLNRDHLYHQGDALAVKAVARDNKGRPKTYGGDFLRARLSNDRWPRVSSAGSVTDHANGTYTVIFPLYWVGNVSVRIQLVHPSEAVKVLRRVREVPNKRVFFCAFLDVAANTTETRQCFSSANTSLPPHQQCDFSNLEANGTWICERPREIPCATISKCWWDWDKTKNKALALVSLKERKLFQKPYVEEELKEDHQAPIRVLPPELRTPQHLQACTWDKSAALGHWSGKVWKSAVCNVRIFTKEAIRRCLANKTVYMQVLKSGNNSYWNTSVRYRFHSFPVQVGAWVTFSDLRYTSDVLDAMQGGSDTVIVLGLWAHFTAEPLDMFRSRLYAIHDAIHRLKHRHPSTRVFVRTGTTREHEGRNLAFYLLGSDWLAYQITEVIRKMFRADPDVVVLDTWDMSVCQPGEDSVHPDQRMVDNQLIMMLSHICPN